MQCDGIRFEDWQINFIEAHPQNLTAIQYLPPFVPHAWYVCMMHHTFEFDGLVIA